MQDQMLRDILYFRLWEKMKTKLNKLQYLHRNNVTALYFSVECGMSNAISIFQYYSFICYHFVRCVFHAPWGKIKLNY